MQMYLSHCGRLGFLVLLCVLVAGCASGGFDV
jgi:hypothetical protein